jgi:hypothetical protein
MNHTDERVVQIVALGRNSNLSPGRHLENAFDSARRRRDVKVDAIVRAELERPPGINRDRQVRILMRLALETERNRQDHVSFPRWR